jgi:hypothetical protein
MRINLSNLEDCQVRIRASYEASFVLCPFLHSHASARSHLEKMYIKILACMSVLDIENLSQASIKASIHCCCGTWHSMWQTCNAPGYGIEQWQRGDPQKDANYQTSPSVGLLHAKLLCHDTCQGEDMHICQSTLVYVKIYAQTH